MDIYLAADHAYRQYIKKTKMHNPPNIFWIQQRLSGWLAYDTQTFKKLYYVCIPPLELTVL